MPTEPLVVLKDLHLRLNGPTGEVPILNGIDLQIDAGEVVGVVGPSGSGKTSLLMVVAGLEPATSGELNVAGHALRGQSEDALALFRRDNIGIVFQSFHLIPTMSALENVALPMEFAGMDNAFDRARDMLAKVGLDKRIDHTPGQLSGGEQQRVGLARALATEPRLLLADEPTGNLDGSTGEMISDLLLELTKARGAALMLITHDPALANRCDRQVHMAGGLLSQTAGGV